LFHYDHYFITNFYYYYLLLFVCLVVCFIIIIIIKNLFIVFWYSYNYLFFFKLPFFVHKYTTLGALVEKV